MSLEAAFDTPETRQRHVRRLFATIADRYDLITRVLSYGMDGRWKAQLVARAAVVPGERALDLACGTGDLAFALAARGATVVGLDVTHRMLQLAVAKGRAANATGVTWTVGDMGALPCPARAFTLVTTSYGLRNVPDIETAIDEIVRVLAPGGRLLSLDFNRPSHPAVRGVYLGYLTAVGNGGNLLAYVCGHSAWELTAIVVSGTAGLRLGWSLVDGWSPSQVPVSHRMRRPGPKPSVA